MHRSLTRRDLLRAAGLGLVSLSIPGWPASTGAPGLSAAPKRPNIVIALCDDLGYGDLACYGHPHIQSPNLDRLALEGVRLTDCYATAPVCSPARAGMLTGRTPL